MAKKKKIADSIGRRTNQILRSTSGKGTTYKEARDLAAAAISGKRKSDASPKPPPRSKDKQKEIARSYRGTSRPIKASEATPEMLKEIRVGKKYKTPSRQKPESPRRIPAKDIPSGTKVKIRPRRKGYVPANQVRKTKKKR